MASTAAITVVALVLMVLAVLLVVSRLTAGRIDGSLRDRIAATESVMRRNADGSLRVPRAPANVVIDSVWVFDADGTQVSGPDAGDEVRRTVDELSRVTSDARRKRDERVYLAEPIQLPGDSRASGVAVATASVEPYEGTQSVLLGGLVVLGVLVTAVTAGITTWTVRRTLRPVEQMTGLAAEWSEKDLETRFELGPSNDEFTRLGSTLNGLLDRVANAIRNEQQLTAELAHELRTPLTTIRAEAELGLMSETDPTMQDRLARVLAQVDRLTGTIATLLTLARHMNGPSHRADLRDVLQELTEARGTAVPIELRADGATNGAVVAVAADPELVERVIAPVLDNALRYARTGVTIEYGRTGRYVAVRVVDDGPGIHHQVDDIFLAGVRDPDAGGAGLGLPLSRRVAAGLGGSVQIASYREPTVIEIVLPGA